MGTAASRAGDDESDVVVFTLVRCEATDVDGDHRVLYEVYPPSASVDDEGPFERTVVGYAEMPAETYVPACGDWAAFERRLDAAADYVHVKER